MIILFLIFAAGVALGWFWRKDEEEIKRMERELSDAIDRMIKREANK